MTDQVIPDQPPSIAATGGLLFNRVGAGVLAALTGLAAWFDQSVPVLLLTMLLALVLVVLGWSRAALARLVFTRVLEKDRAFPGETVPCRSQIANRKLLPLVRVDIADRFPEGVAPKADGAAPAGFHYSEDGLALTTSLLWYQKASWSHALVCRHRGCYAIGPATVRSGDLFGLLSRSREAAGVQRLIVYPRIYELRDLGLPSGSPLGDSRAVNILHHDPLRFRGLREHTPEVPLRHIHWKATARSGRLQAKTFDPSCALRVAVLLDCGAFRSPDSRGTEGPFELAISTAASLAWHHSGARVPVGLFADARLADGAASVAIRPKAGFEHLADLLEALAKVVEPSADGGILDVAASAPTSGTTLALVSGGLAPATAGHLSRLRRGGFSVQLFLVGPASLPDFGLPCRRVLTERPGGAP